MKRYNKPVAVMNEEMTEGIYAASGKDCYSVSAYIHQKPETGRGDYRIQVNGQHHAADGHHSGRQVLVLTFNKPVVYVSSQGSYVSGNNGNRLVIKYPYHNNANDNIGLGDVVVTADEGLGNPSAVLYCNLNCGQHTW